MDLQKPDKSRPATRKDRDETSKYSMNEYGQLQTPALQTPAAGESDEVDPRQNRQERTAAELGTASSIPDCPGGVKLCGKRQHPATPSHVTAMRIPPGIALDALQIRQLRHAALVPPVTKASLSELDLESIMRNIHLRSDASFEPGLHFRPDLEGEQGRRKRKMAEAYWGALLTEIMIYTYLNISGSQPEDVRTVQVPDSGILQDGFFRPRLPTMFETLLEVLKTLVPERDHDSVVAHLDVTLLMQQVRHGVFDFVSLATWLAKLLKMHCAPMRDQVADEMVAHITEGSASQDMGRVITGLQTLFSALEMMKLDVANYQIREFRSILIRDTVPFLQDYFCNNLASHEFRVEDAKRWYENERRRVTDMSMGLVKQSFYPVAVLLRGLCELLIQDDNAVKFPQTFYFDTQRLLQLRADVQKVIHIQVCWLVYQRLVVDQDSCRHQHPNFTKRILALLDDNDIQDFSLGTAMRNDASVAIEIARLVSEAMGRGNEVSDEMLKLVETGLRKYFGRNSPVLGHVRDSLRRILVPSTCELAQRYIDMTPNGICESQRARDGEAQVYHVSSLRNISTRLAHIGVLHWRVWAPLVYLAEP